LFIAKNKKAGSKIKEKYSEIREEQIQKREEKKDDFQDPLSSESPVFPNVDDFTVKDDIEDENNASSNQENDFAEELPIEEQPAYQEPLEDDSQVQYSSHDDQQEQSETELPKSHSFADEDQKLMQELGSVDHGEFDGKEVVNPEYQKPPLTLLDSVKNIDQSADKALIRKNTQTLLTKVLTKL